MAEFKDAVIRLVHDGEDMTLRQLALLMEARSYNQDGDLYTVRGMAERLRVAKPVITRALDVLAEKQLIERRPDPDDRRSVLVHMTPKGCRFADRLLA